MALHTNPGVFGYGTWTKTVLCLLVRLYDLIICTHITCRPFKDNPEHEKVDRLRLTGYTPVLGEQYEAIDSHIYYQYTMSANFMAFINTSSKLQYKLYLYSDKKKEMTPLPLEDKEDYTIERNANNYHEVTINFLLEKNEWHKIKRNSELLFVLRVTDNNTGSIGYPFPSPDDQEVPRWLGVLFNVKQIDTMDDSINLKVRVDSEFNLKDMKKWKN